MPENSEAIRTIKVVAVFLFACLVIAFFTVLPDAHAGEIANALGVILGGIIGAGGAVWAVFLTLDRQRKDEIAKVSDAVRTEITGYVKYVMGAVEICRQITNGIVNIPIQDARYIAKNFWSDPVVYPAVADRIGLLSHPHATTEFYMRLSEVKNMLEALRIRTSPPSATYVTAPAQFVTPAFAATIADSLITALQLARPIVANEGDPATRSQLSTLVQGVVAGQIDECLKSAQADFPNSEAFKLPP
jgi:hypothetical protein